MTKLEQLLAEMNARRNGGFGGTIMDQPEEESVNPILELLRGQSLEPYALDPSMGDQRLRVPRAYGPGGGGVFFTGGSPFKVDKKDQRTLAQGAMAKTIMDVLSGRVANAMSDKEKRRRPQSTDTGPAADQYNGGYYAQGHEAMDPKVLREMLEADEFDPDQSETFVGPRRRY